MEEEAEIYDGIRAQFPLSFGKQSKSQTPLESLHKSTLRATAATTTPSTAADDQKPSSSSRSISEVFPSISSSSKACLDTLKNPNRNNPNPNPNLNSSLSDDMTIGLPRPPLAENGEEDDGEMIGPPPPPPAADEDDDGDEMIGPPRPPMGMVGSDTEDDDESGGEEMEAYRIPLSNEIVLKGHTKVIILYLSLSFCFSTRFLFAVCSGIVFLQNLLCYETQLSCKCSNV